jgi:hypothetical protein
MQFICQEQVLLPKSQLQSPFHSTAVALHCFGPFSAAQAELTHICGCLPEQGSMQLLSLLQESWPEFETEVQAEIKIPRTKTSTSHFITSENHCILFILFQKS